MREIKCKRKRKGILACVRSLDGRGCFVQFVMTCCKEELERMEAGTVEGGVGLRSTDLPYGEAGSAIGRL